MTPNVFFFSLFFGPSASAAGAGVDGLSEGELVISEFMANPRSAQSAVGEWIEIHNPTSQDIDLQGLTVVANGSFTVNQSVTVSAGAKRRLMRRAPARAWRADQSQDRVAPIWAVLAMELLTQRLVKTSTGTTPALRVS